MVVDQTGEEGVGMAVDQTEEEGEATAVDQTEEGEAMAVDQMVRTDRMATGVAIRATRGVAEQKEVMAANLPVEVMEADLTVEVMAADLKEEEGTTVNLGVKRVVMAADLEEVSRGRMVLVVAGEDSRAIKVEVEEERDLEVFRKEGDIKTEVEEVRYARILVRGVLVHQPDLLELLLCPQDMTDKVLVIDRVLELVVDTILGDHLHLLQGIMIGELHPQ